MRVTKPREGEPIRLVETGKGVRYRAVLDVAPTGGKRRQVTRTFDTIREARAFVDETRTAVIQGAFTAPSKVTMRALADRWLADRQADSEAGGIREVSVNGYRSALHAVLLHIGDEPAQGLSPADVRALLRTLATEGGKWRRGLSHRSIVYALGTLRQVLDHGVEAGLLSRNVAAGVKPPKAKAGDRRTVVVWSAGELATFRGHVDGLPVNVLAADPWLRVGMRLTLCGLRRSEVLGLDWCRVDLTAGTVRVEQGRVKTGRGRATAHGDAKSDDSHRTVPVEVFHAGTATALRELWLAQGRPTSGLVVVDALGTPVDPDVFSRRFRVLSDGAAVPDLGSIHNVRHTIATALHDNGVEPRKAASLLGHKVTTHLAFYVPTSDAGASEAAQVAGGLFTVAQ
ncbi:tyrosine-type recombinase/integrase [Nocardioides dongxiaopingii]|uniref:site-specific integrase n=1 Tax=Nocardioides sp. S-1144 TaxID=2582905 RepID=UPI00110D9E10|nr:tyrosine-type recombinase/integrase [Nocardioides sp. S-1144]QCW51462.1 tyrosine-type recombinase/integrase [Nocardioides sp. S-1144]